MKSYRSIVIDAKNKTVSEYDFTDLETAKKHLGWEIAASACRWDSDLMLVDDEGLLKGIPEHYFMLRDFQQPIATNAIIVGNDDEGGTADVKLSVNDIRSQCLFLNFDQAMQIADRQQKAVDLMRDNPEYKSCIFTTMKEALESNHDE